MPKNLNNVMETNQDPSEQDKPEIGGGIYNSAPGQVEADQSHGPSQDDNQESVSVSLNSSGKDVPQIQVEPVRRDSAKSIFSS